MGTLRVICKVVYASDLMNIYPEMSPILVSSSRGINSIMYLSVRSSRRNPSLICSFGEIIVFGCSRTVLYLWRSADRFVFCSEININVDLEKNLILLLKLNSLFLGPEG
ncbi:hypothetical protein NE237_024985 [Protea cynaroides]|uniref:Uncharacterized protein n=1 Tax=Protea cynaroides TaxID=273540 RepID=A0A9Q0JZ27_9MAGN|nr:hypothetical protein NE237_024985 [Protea cynaroides]